MISRGTSSHRPGTPTNAHAYAAFHLHNAACTRWHPAHAAKQRSNPSKYYTTSIHTSSDTVLDR